MFILLYTLHFIKYNIAYEMHWRQYGNIGKVSKYHLALLLVILFLMSLFVLCYRLGVKQFGVRAIYSSNSQCSHLHEIALDMISNGDRVGLPSETNNTGWTLS